MLNFRVQRVREVNRGAYFPEPVQTSQKVFSVSRAMTLGFWSVTRLIVGDVATVRRIIADAVAQYDFTRMKHPELTNIALYSTMPQLLDTHLEVWRYSGSVQSISRESVMILYNHGQVRALDRNLSVGFSCVIRKARQPWSQDAWIQNEFRKAIVRSVALRGNVTRVPLREVERVVMAARQQLQTEQLLAFERLRTTYTDERYKEAIAAWDALVAFEEQIRAATTMCSNPDTVVPITIPSLAKVQELWKQSYLPDFTHEDYAPFLDVKPEAPARRVTLCRGAVMTDGRMFITLNTRPRLTTHRLDHPVDLHSGIQYATYAPPPDAPVTVALSPARRMQGGGVGGRTFQLPNITGWDGSANIPAGWSMFTSKETPEINLALYPRVRTVSREPAALMRAVNWPKPTLVAGAGSCGQALPLVLPEMMLSADLTPAISNYHLLEPLDPNYTVAGQVVSHDGTSSAVAPNIAGFIDRPLSGRPSRTAILPDLFGT